MNTVFLLLAQYDGRAFVPLAEVCRDFFGHLTPEGLLRKVEAGQIALPVIRTDPSSQKTAKVVHVADLADYIDHHRWRAGRDLRTLGRLGARLGKGEA